MAVEFAIWNLSVAFIYGSLTPERTLGVPAIVIKRIRPSV